MQAARCRQVDAGSPRCNHCVQVRHAAEDQIPGFQASVEHNPVQRKVFTIPACGEFMSVTCVASRSHGPWLANLHLATGPGILPRGGLDYPSCMMPGEPASAAPET
jgi:hypothetical protein